MEESDADRLFEVAASFRVALESYLLERPGVSLSTDPGAPLARFPKHHCKASALTFGLYLRSIYWPGRLAYVWGVRNGESHGWLEVDQMLVDLTADQFLDEQRAVIVADALSSEWHAGFAPHTRLPSGVRIGHRFHTVAEEVGRRIRSGRSSTEDRLPNER